MLEDSDIVTINRVLNGDTNAYADLVNRYQQYAFTLAYRIIPNREDAEEITQDSFVKAYRYLKDFRKESKFSTWLYTIVHRNAISFLRKNNLEAQSISDREDFIADKSNILLQINQRSEQQTISKALEYLKPDEASIISLFYLQEQSLDEIGTVLGIESNTAKVRLFRARQKFKNILETHFSELKTDLGYI